jgi:hypothetical protein
LGTEVCRLMVKKGEKGVPRSPETRLKIGIGSRKTRLSEKRPCTYGCGGVFNSGNMVTHIGKHHEFKCKLDGCPNDGKGKTGLGYCGPHYRLSFFCIKVGITLEDYYRIYDEQNGKCKLCSREGTLQCVGTPSKIDVLFIDHCHSSGQFRGLLCYRCNLALGQFDDNIETIENAVAYLKGNL